MLVVTVFCLIAAAAHSGASFGNGNTELAWWQLSTACWIFVALLHMNRRSVS